MSIILKTIGFSQNIYQNSYLINNHVEKSWMIVIFHTMGHTNHSTNYIRSRNIRPSVAAKQESDILIQQLYPWKSQVYIIIQSRFVLSRWPFWKISSESGKTFPYKTNWYIPQFVPKDQRYSILKTGFWNPKTTIILERSIETYSNKVIVEINYVFW